MARLMFILPLCYFVAVTVTNGLQLPDVYHVTGTIYLPRASIAEPFEAWVDFKKGMSRIDYYDGDAQYINRGDISQYGATFMIVFETTKEYMNMRTCFGGNGTSDFKVMPQGIFPDMSNYTLTNTTAVHEGVKCDEYYYEFQENTKQNKYVMLINHATGMPVLLTFTGVDNVLGSHYDQYVFEYDKVETTIDYSVFDIYQTMSCDPFLDASLAHVMHANPAFELIGLPDHDRSVQTAQLDKQFEEFKKKHGKDYRDDKEHEQRKAYFRNNYRFINSNNRRALTYSLAINHLTDLSDDELKMMRGYRHTKEAKGGIEFTSDIDVELIPNSWDWRIHGAVSLVKDQGICGSCWSFGTTGTIEGAYFLKHKMMVTMSEQALVDCSWGYGNFGCDGGETVNAYQWIMDNGCIPNEYSYGMYLQQDGYCHNKAAWCGAKLSNYSTIPSGDVDSLRVAVATKGPIAVAIDASHKSFSFYDFGVYYEPNCGNMENDLDHSVLAIGYGTLNGEDYWLIKNSWSPLWGNQGYVMMSRKDNNCGVATQADFAIVE